MSTALILLGLYGGNGLSTRIAWTIMGPLPVLFAAEHLVADAALGEERRAEVLGRLVEAMVSGPGSRATESPAPAQERGAPDGGGRP